MSLTAQQEQVLAQISAGITIADAAASAGIHRNTIQNWLRSDPEFQHALAHARQANALQWQAKAEQLAADALETIRSLMTNPKTPPATRLRAAQIILNLATNPPMNMSKFVHKSAQGGVGISASDSLPDTPPQAPDPADPEPAKVHKCAQSLPQPEPMQPLPEVPELLEIAVALPEQQQPYRRPTPKIGRNELCPCGSGRKFKHCCLDKNSAVPSPTLSAA